MTPAWSDWQPLELNSAPSAATLAEILDGGQAFRWHRQADGAWRGAWAECIAELKISGDGLRWRAPLSFAPQTGPALRDYFATDKNWQELTDALPWRSDAHLARCLAAFPGLRILRQPLGETLLHFLCSATKQIVQIKQMSALLAKRHGATLASEINRLPTWPELAEIPE
ncbi:MAG TPA: DNA glycosylase, partial [Opitutaceae bacterium]|nr:DNA glycosylase [Opitutaceae bacterium]